MDGRGWLVLGLAAGAAAAAAASGAGSSPARVSALRRCDGSERWAIKTLADPHAAKVVATPRRKSVRQLWAFTRPAGFDPDVRNDGAEMHVYKVTGSLVEARWVNEPRRTDKRGHLHKGGDLDIHLVIAPADAPDDTQHRMIVEFPFPRCVAPEARWKDRIVAARDAFITACGSPSGSFHRFQGTATIKGVGFFDRPHATGHAKDGFELHPVTAFSSSDCSH
jgi:hypothetical protein